MSGAKNTFDFSGSISVPRGLGLRDQDYVREMTSVIHLLGLPEGREKVAVIRPNFSRASGNTGLTYMCVRAAGGLERMVP